MSVNTFGFGPIQPVQPVPHNSLQKAVDRAYSNQPTSLIEMYNLRTLSETRSGKIADAAAITQLNAEHNANVTAHKSNCIPCIEGKDCKVVNKMEINHDRLITMITT